MVPAAGVEPATFALQEHCSAVEPRRQVAKFCHFVECPLAPI